MDNIFKKVGRLPVITHKEFRDKHPELIQGHFGVIEGLNLPEFEGKDIIVLSQYNLNPTAYLLKAATLGINLEGKDLETKYRRWNYNGFAFHYEEYKDPDIWKVQFSCIEAEMLQVIGRARHLRHDVTVHYFGNFPLSQAIIVDKKGLAKPLFIQGGFTMRSKEELLDLLYNDLHQVVRYYENKQERKKG